jgi:hypothetical protein
MCSLSWQADRRRFRPTSSRQHFPELSSVPRIFVNLQEQRHLADYGVSISLLRAETFLLIDQAERTFGNWNLIRETDEAKVFLAALVFGKRWDR